ncbi:hypothetical protein RIF29_08609 [Crotalaria pallida]|uniref:Uncharacterized protein n=1 Tax=Crotalaria pallida TaxID=3830 RepID=A0AAN9FXH1_CROPI
MGGSFEEGWRGGKATFDMKNNLQTFKEIQDILKLSYDGLDGEERDIFLLRWYNWTMHDLIREMGKEIVCGESNDPRDQSHSKPKTTYGKWSYLERLWDGVQNLVKLRKILLSKCKHLTELPDFSKAVNIECVDLFYCTRLLALRPSILSLQNLAELQLKGCNNLKSLQSGHQFKSLKYINARGCTSLKEFSVTSENMKGLDLAMTSMAILHSLDFLINKHEYWNCGFSKTLPHNSST